MADRHPLDGNARAADAHYDRPEMFGDGDPCPYCDEGHLIVEQPDEDNPRGSICCDECGETPDD